MSATYIYSTVYKHTDHHQQVEKLGVGGFTVSFEEEEHFVLVRLTIGQGLEIRIPHKPSVRPEFMLSRKTSIAFCTPGNEGIFSEDYIRGNQVDGRFQELFNRLIRREVDAKRGFFALKMGKSP